MRFSRVFFAILLGMGIAGFLAVAPPSASAFQAAQSVAVDSDDLGGIVTSSKGPEAGVWVIAETTDLPTKLAKIVVTDDRGRYVIPDLPKANYNVWVRGYGLVDSPKVQSWPGKTLDLKAVVAPDKKAAAQYYPPIYWFSMLKVPDKSEFPGTGANGNGIGPTMKTQAHWLRMIRTDGCWTCHQLGNEATRTLSKDLGKFDSSVAAWDRRIQSGQAGRNMANSIAQMGRKRTLETLANWTDRIAAGELPAEAPPRPQGVERNVVVTLWDWADPKGYLHDEIASDRNNPRINAKGPIYGSMELSTDYMPVLDPVNNKAWQVKIPIRDPKTPSSLEAEVQKPSIYWGDEKIWTGQANAHNPMIDYKGRVWLTSRVRGPENPPVCLEGSSHPSAKFFPNKVANRHLSVYDPKTKEFIPIGTCYSTHHLQFANDANHTLWTSGGGPVIGWFNTKVWDETHDEEKAQGWAPLIVDTNGNGKRDDYVEPDLPVDATKDKRLATGFYGVSPSPVDNSVWGSALGFPGAILRVVPGANPPETTLTEIYEIPWDNPKAPVQGYAPRGMDIDLNGVVWAPLSSGHFASFDRRKCKGPLNGPKATGQHCPEGWTLYEFPGPKLNNAPDSGSAEASYYNWVDQYDTFGLGKNVPIATGNGNDALLALMPDTKKWVTMRVPYPMGFYAKGMDGRIDDPNAGWKGKGLWSTFANRTPFHGEGSKGTTSKVVYFQLRPNPLAK